MLGLWLQCLPFLIALDASKVNWVWVDASLDSFALNIIIIFRILLGLSIVLGLTLSDLFCDWLAHQFCLWIFSTRLQLAFFACGRGLRCLQGCLSCFFLWFRSLVALNRYLRLIALNRCFRLVASVNLLLDARGFEPQNFGLLSLLDVRLGHTDAHLCSVSWSFYVFLCLVLSI